MRSVASAAFILLTLATGPAQAVRLPPGIRTIDGSANYLIPGLADMHAHLYSDGSATWMFATAS